MRISTAGFVVEDRNRIFSEALQVVRVVALGVLRSTHGSVWAFPISMA